MSRCSNGLGLRAANALIKHFKEPERVFDSRRDELEALGIPPEVADHALSAKSLERAEQEWEKAAALGNHLMQRTVAGILAGSSEPAPQDHSRATHVFPP